MEAEELVVLRDWLGLDIRCLLLYNPFNYYKKHHRQTPINLYSFAYEATVTPFGN